MNKREFLNELRKGLSSLSETEIEERIIFYSEMIDDRIEEGLTEEEAVAAIGSVYEIIGQAVTEAPTEKPDKKRSLKVWEIVLLILGSPIWLSLAAAAFVVAVSLYISVWAVITSLWSVFGAFVGTAVGGIIGGIVLCTVGKALNGITLIGGGLLCAGLAIFAFFGCKAASKGTVLLTKKFFVWLKGRIMGKEENV